MRYSIATPTWEEFRRVLGALFKEGYVYVGRYEKRVNDVAEAERLENSRNDTFLPKGFILINYDELCAAKLYSYRGEGLGIMIINVTLEEFLGRILPALRLSIKTLKA